jgi:hypothetical protein
MTPPPGGPAGCLLMSSSGGWLSFKCDPSGRRSACGMHVILPSGGASTVSGSATGTDSMIEHVGDVRAEPAEEHAGAVA